jgi:hypothetical protein
LGNPDKSQLPSAIFPKPNFPLSTVDVRLSGLTLFRLSKLLFMLCGGVIGDCFDTRFGGSVGRRTAGTYKGDLGGRSCRGWTGRGRPAGVRGEVGEEL